MSWIRMSTHNWWTIPQQYCRWADYAVKLVVRTRGNLENICDSPNIGQQLDVLRECCAVLLDLLLMRRTSFLRAVTPCQSGYRRNVERPPNDDDGEREDAVVEPRRLQC